ncbi:MAG: valine--tRNA ligase [Candidatus Limnocylindrales bacterium]
MAPAYGPAEVEPRTYQRWLDADVFPPDGKGTRPDPDRPPFTIVQPPPNVTGALHIGHALTSTVEDLMVRRARMQGRETLFLPGMDHASIAAQVVLDRILAKEGESRESLGRERYLERMWTFVTETRDVIADQERRLGISADWSRMRFTMDEGSAKAVRVAFKKLYDDGLAYRGEQLINWCPTDLTSLSDLEVVATPTKGTLWYVRYHLVDDDGKPLPNETITVATTRPETILGDTAVAVHPDDERYRHVVGRKVLIPFVARIVPILADDVVKQDFGTGAVKITPAHDAEDFATGKRHGLPMIDVMNDDGHINERGGPFSGLTREEARSQIVAALETAADLEKAEPHEMILGRCQRSDDVVEPRLKTQWFINVKPMAERAMASVRAGRTTFVPDRFTKVFFDWMENIHDWNVSRQLWWGHRIPAWYCPDGHVTVSAEIDGPDTCATCGRAAAELHQDEDIFDTWFSSGLWPFSTLGWPDDTPDFRRFYPNTVMETGYDIIFFWVARMMMLGEWLTGREPFHTVYLHGMVRDPYGSKMSKTKGNVVDPLEVIYETGADALRFALIHGSAAGADARLGPSRLEGGRNFANKLWNAARFVLSVRPAEMGDGAPLGLVDPELIGPAEHWILDRCARNVAAVENAYADFEFGEAARLLYDAVWSEYCDWYLELAKIGLSEPSGDAADGARKRAIWSTLAWVLDRYLRLLHPIMPMVTEEIWGRLPHLTSDPQLLIIAQWPTASDAGVEIDQRAAEGVAELVDMITAIRAARAESGIEASDWLPALIWLPEAPARDAYPQLEAAVGRLARVRPKLVDDRAALDAQGGDGLAVIPTTGEARLLRSDADVERERTRLEKDLRAAEAQLAATEARLNDDAFVSRAPASIVEQVRHRAAELNEQIAALRARLGEA